MNVALFSGFGKVAATVLFDADPARRQACLPFDPVATTSLGHFGPRHLTLVHHNRRELGATASRNYWLTLKAQKKDYYYEL